METKIEENKVDMDLYSRQIGAFGLETMTKLIKMRVLVVGLRGLGMEICKNLILAGPKSVSIWDPRPCQTVDRSSNFYITQEHVTEKTSKADACLESLKILNPYVKVSKLESPNFSDLQKEENLEKWDLVVLSEIFDYSEMVLLNSALRSKNKGFILASTQGLLGFCFTDFGAEHLVFDKNGEANKSVLVSSITKSGAVTTQEDKRHDLEKGDLVKFEEVVGLDSLQGKVFEVEDCPTPFTVQLKGFENLFSEEEQYQRNGILTQVKRKINPGFRGLQTSLLDMDSAEFPSPPDLDFEHLNRTLQLKFILSKILRNLNLFVPKGFNFKSRRVAKNTELLRQFLFSDEKIEESVITEWKTGFETDLVMKCLAYWNTQYSPITSFWGGIVAQEIVKFTGKFSPISQWMIHEFYSNIFKSTPMEDLKPRLALSEKYSENVSRDLIMLLGEEGVERLRNSNIFMVGAGALGCEYLKMFSLLGLGCGDNGLITITDDDSIENSNLNRQFLFRKKHIGQFKSQVAAEVASENNPSLKTKALTNRVGIPSENIFSDPFFDSLTFIVNAVDNVKARLYMDGKAVLHKKWLFESGTLGTKCNSQVIIPGKTESYADSKDPEEKGVPMCTLRNFPFLIEHCIEWSREHFFSQFSSASRELSSYLQGPEEYVSTLKEEAKKSAVEVTERIQGLEQLADLAKDPSVTQMIHFIRRDFDTNYDTKIKKLLKLFPADYTDENGNLFWTSPKRPPQVVEFNSEKKDHLDYLTTGLSILCQIFNVEFEELSKEQVEEHLSSYSPLQQEEGDQEEEKKKMTNENAQQDVSDLSEKIEAIEAKLNEINPETTVKALEFEKDDDSNGHIDFMTLSSNLRAETYQINKASRHKIKMIAGKIIPAIATTTAMVVGAMGMEMLKFYNDCELESFRDFFANLGIAFINFSEPFPPKITRDKEYDVIMMGPVKALPSKWDTWSRVEIKGTSLKMKDFIEKVAKKFGVVVESVSKGKAILWTSYGMGEETLEMELEQVYKEKIGDFSEDKKYFVFNVSAVDSESDEITILLPPVVYLRGEEEEIEEKEEDQIKEDVPEEEVKDDEPEEEVKDDESEEEVNDA